MQSKLLNGKKMIKYVILGIIVIAAAVAVVFLLNKNTPTGGDGDDEFNYPDIDTNSVDFDYIEISETGMSALIDVLKVEKRDNGVYIAHLYKSMADEDYLNIIREKVYGPEVLKVLQNILSEQKVLSWNGFSGKNPPGVLDGTSMSFEMTLADGSMVSASGSNNFPKNYDTVRSAIASYVGDELLESNVFEGKFVKVKLPENWIGKVYVSYGDDYNAFYMKTSENDHFLLLRLDYREYEISDPEKLTRVGMLTKGDAELYFEINNYQTYLNKDKAEADEIAIYEALASTIEDISANAEAINGWTLNR